MNISKLLILGTGAVMALAAPVLADSVTNVTTVRTTAYMQGVAQRPGATQPLIDYPTIASHNLVNLAMGRDLAATNFPNQLLALTFRCDLSAADIVVYDTSASNVVGTLAIGASNDFYTADLYTTNGVNIPPNGMTNSFTRFISLMQILPGASPPTNSLVGGFLTVTGRIHRDPVTGCPLPVKISLDKDKYDTIFDYKDISNGHDKDSVHPYDRTGLGTLMGAIEFVQDGSTNALLIPLGALSLRYDLPHVP